uniref:Uncharacterized protein n=1 Tax=Aegilops tauschii TaxID=37682 RepID=M8C9D1_AEGTA
MSNWKKLAQCCPVFTIQTCQFTTIVRNMLDDMLEKNLEIVRNPCLNLADPEETGGGIKLFKKAPPGIRMDAVDKYHVQLKRPKILPGPEVDEKSKKFRHMLQSVVVDGNDVLVSAKEASQISLARMEARETAAKTKAKREEERVNQLKKVRGEKWLPSIASKMKIYDASMHYVHIVSAERKILGAMAGKKAQEQWQ